jgi:AsmA-like C-terminal region
MNDMFKSRPLLLLVITLCLVVVALASFWLAALPKRMLANLQHNLSAQHGLALEAGNPQLSFADGIALQIENVSLIGKAENSFSLSAQLMRVETGLASLFGTSIAAQHIALQRAVISADVSLPFTLGLATGTSIRINDASLRLRDGKRNSVISLSDVNGDISTAPDGSAKASLSFLLSDTLTTFTADIESAGRLNSDGSPTDFLFSAKNRLVAFSGRVKLSQGLELVGQANFEADDTAQMFHWLGLPQTMFESSGPLALNSGVSVSGLNANLKSLAGTVGPSTVSGNVKIATGPDRTEVSGELQISRLSLLGPKTETSLLAMPWSEQPFANAEREAAQIGVAVKVDDLQVRERKLGPVQFLFAMDNQTTSISLGEQVLAGGLASGDLKIEQNKGQRDVSASLSAKDVDATLLLGGLLGLETTPGPINVVTNITANGRSPAALISTLRGDLAMDAKSLEVNAVNFVSLLSKPGEGWKSVEKNLTSPLQVSFEALLQEGVLTLQKADLQTSTIALKPKGEIDLLRQAFEVQLQPKGKGADPKMTLTGPWLKPTFSNTIAVKEKSTLTPPAN